MPWDSPDESCVRCEFRRGKVRDQFVRAAVQLCNFLDGLLSAFHILLSEYLEIGIYNKLLPRPLMPILEKLFDDATKDFIMAGVT